MTRTAVAVAVLVLGAAPAGAQELRWRTDYTAARKEAAATGRPLLLDFAAEWCGPCKRMEATTFRDPSFAAAVNGHVIPVKVDADRDQWLVKAAGVEAFPTLVLVSADGKVIARNVGYADAATAVAFLRRAPEPRPAVAAQPAPAPVQPVVAVVASPAGEMLAAAKADHAAGRYLACIERCDRIGTEFGGSPEAAEARRLAAGITADPEKWRRVTAQLEADLVAARRNIAR